MVSRHHGLSLFLLFLRSFPSSHLVAAESVSHIASPLDDGRTGKGVRMRGMDTGHKRSANWCVWIPVCSSQVVGCDKDFSFNGILESEHGATTPLLFRLDVGFFYFYRCGTRKLEDSHAFHRISNGNVAGRFSVTNIQLPG
ncbi:hypothetical protein QBC35DRAFT_185280 [Podospora australis]|uniref:Secreted protein n=1 Tax=Podospora australis TaxID=1536484 RepID=A0AAN7AKE5_9PEZI|nr:hypothetical protein QBC35DRAFT_185280 [Podospora australis]